MHFIKKLASLTGAAVETAADNADMAIASAFPKVYSKAAFNQLTNEKDALGRQLIEAETRLERETADVTRVNARIAQISKTLDAGGAYSREAYEQAPAGQKERIKVAAATLRAEKDKLAAQLPNEDADVTNATRRLERIRGLYEKFKTNLENFERMSKDSQDKLAEAKDRRTEADLRKQEAEALAGLGGAFNGLNSAMEGMNRAVEQAEQEAKLAERNAEEKTASSGANVDQLLANANKQPAPAADPWAA